MKYLLNSREMRQCDTNTIESFGISQDVLMERAALCSVQKMKESDFCLDEILIVCGQGNNGGDGLAIARLLKIEGFSVTALIPSSSSDFSKGMKSQLKIAEKYNVPLIERIDDKKYTMIVDAIFGIGLSRNIEGEFAEWIGYMNQSTANIVSIDIPSGISADTGNVMGTAVKADLTVTFAYEKLGMRLYPGADYCGQIFTADIGINEYSWMDKRPGRFALERTDLSDLPKRQNRSHKGTFGKLLVIAGRCNMAGAAVFASKAAYASGCGLVKVFTEEENRTILGQQVPEAILSTYSSKKLDKQLLTDSVKWADVVAIGPGIGTDEISIEMVKTVLAVASVPVVLDADALNVLAMDTSILLRPHTELVVTPHLGEMASLTETSISYIMDNLISQAEEFAREFNVICVLKDARSVCSIPYGKTYLNLSGNHGMATAGSGDVLCGLIAGLIAQGMQPELAAPFGTFIHGCAGDVMVEQTGYHGLMAGDLVTGIKIVMK